MIPVCAKLREKGFSVVIFPDESKLGKQFDYATRNGIPFISINADSEAAAGADLVLSGHTHGGHVFPAGQIGMLMGANDCLYGTQRRGDTDFVVTSGISGWGIPFKTGAISEFVVIDIIRQ